MIDRVEPAREALTAARFAPVRVRRASGVRTRLVTAAWVLGLAGIAGLAVVGRLMETDVPTETRIAVAPLAVATPLAASVPPLAMDPPRAQMPNGYPDQPIVVTSPAVGDPTITAPELIVQGFLQADAASLRVSLETDWYLVAEATVVPALTFGERPGATRHAQFLVRFGLSEPRMTGPMVVRVVALDRDGLRLADVVRPFRLGPVDRPMLGEDGLMGGLSF